MRNNGSKTQCVFCVALLKGEMSISGAVLQKSPLTQILYSHKPLFAGVWKENFVHDDTMSKQHSADIALTTSKLEIKKRLGWNLVLLLLLCACVHCISCSSWLSNNVVRVHL